MTTYLLSIDVGTTGSKAVLMEENGHVRASVTTEYPLSTPRPSWAEQDPADWWAASVASMRRVLEGVAPSEVAGIGLTGQMHGLVLLDAQGAVLRPCIMWNDQRAAPQCAAITRQIGEEEVLALTSNRVLPGFTAPKLLWVREHEPEVYRRIATLLLPKDYLRYRLTGALFSDVSDASGTALFDVRRRRWSERMLQALDVPRAWLPEVTESPAVSARVGAQAARETGLLDGTPVVGGAGDQAAQAVGMGLIRGGSVSVTLGTSGVVFAALDSYQADPTGRLHTFCHAVPGMWHLMGVMLSAGGSLRWYRDALCAEECARAAASGRDPYDLLTEEAAQAPPGCEGLLFLPYLSGERVPYPDPHARGVFFGLSVRHGKAHLTRAVLEGVSYGLRDSLELLRPMHLLPGQISLSGGGARSPLWCQILADVLNIEIAATGGTEGAAYGAALLAGLGAGVYGTLTQAYMATYRPAARIQPGPAAALYAQYYPRYRALYPALAAEFEAMAQVVEQGEAG